ncbi:MAG TPA: hypothetical protein VHG91_00525 [Longimicrobium sp.]|nr:hypothetical protein [Longimicrobium sp.]
MSSARAIRLPDRFYLPRLDADGREVRDVMPWEGAVSYATDGERLGVQFDDGSVAWLGRGPLADDGTPPDPAAALREDFDGVDFDALVEGIRSYMDLHPILKTVWSDDLRALDALRARAPRPAEGAP